MRITMKLVALAVALSASNAMADGTTPPPSPTSTRQPVRAPLGVIKAVVVKSWGGGSGALVWDYLNSHWSTYGPIPLFIDYSSLHEVAGFTLADLQNSAADVVIVSDPAGGLDQWTPAEVAALASYASQGHPLIGTYAMMQYAPTDNRILAPLWGLRSDIAYNSSEVPSAPAAGILAPSNCLFDNIVDPLNQGGYPFVEVPADDFSWDLADLAGASFVARSADGRNVVTTYTNGNLHACYISYMPEFQPGNQFDATQYLYNAIVCQLGATPTVKSSWGRLKATYR
jgi:hypothetical protein